MSKVDPVVLLVHGLKIGESICKSIELRAPLLEDMEKAEQVANPHFSPISYRAALAAVVVVRAEGVPSDTPITHKMLGKLKPSDWRKISAKLDEFDNEGEPTPA